MTKKISMENLDGVQPHTLFDVDQHVTEYLSRDQKKRREKSVHASELGYCLRKTYFQTIKPKPLSIELLGIFELGNVLHEKMTEILENLMKKEGSEILRIESEKRIIFYFPEDDFRISGQYDDLVFLKNGKTVLIEKKSIKNFIYLDAAKDEHIMQANLYAKALMPNETQLVYISKENLAVKSFVVVPDMKIVKLAIARAKTLHHAISNKIPPQKEKSWICRFCDYAKECEKVGG